MAEADGDCNIQAVADFAGNCPSGLVHTVGHTKEHAIEPDLVSEARMADTERRVLRRGGM